jgi:hypothetical protein
MWGGAGFFLFLPKNSNLCFFKKITFFWCKLMFLGGIKKTKYLPSNNYKITKNDEISKQTLISKLSKQT